MLISGETFISSTQTWEVLGASQDPSHQGKKIFLNILSHRTRNEPTCTQEMIGVFLSVLTNMGTETLCPSNQHHQVVLLLSKLPSHWPPLANVTMANTSYKVLNGPHDLCISVDVFSHYHLFSSILHRTDSEPAASPSFFLFTLLFPLSPSHVGVWAKQHFLTSDSALKCGEASPRGPPVWEFNTNIPSH